MKTFTITLLAKVVTEWIGTEESHKRVEFSYTILQRSTGQTPFVLRIKGESGFRGIRRSLFDVVSFVEDYPTCQL